MEHISSRRNAAVTRFRDVSRGEAGGDWILLDGEHLLEEALAAGARVDAAAFTEALAAGRLAPLAAQAERAGAHVFTVTGQVLAAISPARQPSGVVAIARRREAPIDDVFQRKPPLVLMLSGVQDPGNVGAIIRAAEGCGATGIVAGDSTADPFGWKALRGGMGSTLRLPVATRQPLAETVVLARAAGLRILAAAARNGTPLPACDLRGPCAILFGGEGPGLAKDLLEDADERVTIPMRPPVESLNVAVAAALVLYEASRQRSSYVPL
jgi:TrmH family RNA methyltransferase